MGKIRQRMNGYGGKYIAMAKTLTKYIQSNVSNRSTYTDYRSVTNGTTYIPQRVQKDYIYKQNPLTAFTNIRFECKLCEQEARETNWTEHLRRMLKGGTDRYDETEIVQIGDLRIKRGFCNDCAAFIRRLPIVQQNVLLHMINKEKFSQNRRNGLRRAIDKWIQKNPEKFKEIEADTLLEEL